MPKHAIAILIFTAIFLGAFALSLPDGAIRDGFGGMQLALVVAAAYAYWKSLKPRT
jgi:hypothetical protein